MRKRRAQIGSIGALVLEYRASAQFAELKPATRVAYNNAITRMQERSPEFFAGAVKEIRRRHVIRLRDKFKDRPALANQIRAMLSILLQFAVDMEYRDDNPALRIPALKVGERRRWPEPAIAYALETFPPMLRRGIVLALYTGQRQGDVLAMRWSDYDGEGIQVTQEKTGAKLWIPCHMDLQAEIATWPRETLTMIADSKGRPYRSNVFAQAFVEEKRKHWQLNGLTFHGLRKSAAARLAEAGCPDREIASITGHKTLAMISHYTAEVEQKRLARSAINRLERQNAPHNPLKDKA